MVIFEFEFHPEFRPFLQPVLRDRIFCAEFPAHQSLKHILESLGIPHTEIGPVWLDGRVCGLEERLSENGATRRLQVFPAAASEGLVPDPRFVLDNHLGQLAADLRILGFDARYQNDYEDAELAETAAAEQRILLTRDRRLLMRKIVTRGAWIRSLDPQEQIQQVILRFGLLAREQPFQRCLRCNGALQPVAKEEILELLEPLTRRYFDEFRRCEQCGKVYWKGSHYEHMLDRIAEWKGDR